MVVEGIQTSQLCSQGKMRSDIMSLCVCPVFGVDVHKQFGTKRKLQDRTEICLCIVKHRL